MHKSRLGGFIIDCNTEDLDGAAAFWAAALGADVVRSPDPAERAYRQLDMPPGEVYAEVQAVNHPSRVHLDIETDDVDAEVARLVALGARRLETIRGWTVLEAPTGQRFCVVPAVRAGFAGNANTWGE